MENFSNGEDDRYSQEEDDVDFNFAQSILENLVSTAPFHEDPLRLHFEPLASVPMTMNVNSADHKQFYPLQYNRAAVIPDLLLLFDMNGTLLYRHPTKIEDREPDILHNDTFYYVRDQVKDLLTWLKSIHFIKIAFYTSMKKSNAQAAIKYLYMNMNYNSVCLFAQEYNKHDPEGGKSWSMMRDMPRLWNAEGTVAFGHSEQSTLMIDDSPQKMREHPFNVLVIPEYTADKVLCNDLVIHRLYICLRDIAERWCDGSHDIREILCTKQLDYVDLCRLK